MFNPYNCSEISDYAPTITTQCGSTTSSSTVLINEGCMDKPILLGGIGDINFGKQFRQGNRVYDSDGIAMCLMAQPVGNTGGCSYLYLVRNKSNNKGANDVKHNKFTISEERVCTGECASSKIVANTNKIIKEIVPQKVRVRTHKVDVDALKETLREAKKNSKLTNNEISNKLNKPKTLVDHWFRNDNCFSIPDEDIWLDLKNLLNIQTDEFDESIMTFEIRDGVFEQSNRIYDSNGIAPTLTCVSAENERYKVYEDTHELMQVGQLQTITTDETTSCTGECASSSVVMNNENMKLDGNGLMVVGNTVPSGHTAGRIFDLNGLSPTVMYRNSKVVQILDNKGVNNLWNNNLEKYDFLMEEIRIADFFAGIGALHQALKELGVPVRVTALSEIDVDATISYAAGHIDNFKDLAFEYPSIEEMRQWLIDRNIGYSYEKDKSSVPRMKIDKLKLAYKASVLLNNLGDVSKIDYHSMEDFDMFNLSFSCTDLSNAGKQRGMKNADGTPTRSGLYVYGIEAVRAKKPKYIMIENVKGLIQKKFIDDFYSIISELEEIGYNCYYPTKEDKNGVKSPTCLNSKNFGIAQNRERIFVIAIRKDIDNHTFEFPIGKDSGIRLKHMLEDSVDEKYYLSDEIQKRFKLNGKSDDNRNSINIVGTSAPECRTIGQRDITYGVNGIMSTLTATDYKQPKQILNNSTITDDSKIIENGAIRGRYNEDGVIEQRLELRADGITNTLTTVEKDNVIIENTSCVSRIGGCFDTEKSTHQAGSVYDNECLSPTLDTMQGGYRQPCIKVNNNELIKIGCIGADSQGNRVYDINGVSCTQVGQAGGLGAKTGLYEDNFRIRKLTPLECWRLQGFRDTMFHKAQELGISDSQLYKQAGNSITVNVLYYIFKNLFKDYIVD